MGRIDERSSNVVGELGLTVEEAGDELLGRARVVPEMWSPGTTRLRASVVAAWADTLLGLLAVRVLAPRVPVTLELDVHLADPLPDLDEVTLVGHVAKAGRTVLVSRMEVTTGTGQQVGFGHSLFVVNPDPGVTMPAGDWALRRMATANGSLREPLATRLGCERVGPGVARLPYSRDLLNQSASFNGGLLSVVVEEAALAADPAGRPLESLHLRYLRAVRQGPAVARADVAGGVGRVDVHDAGTDALAMIATTRAIAGGTAPPP